MKLKTFAGHTGAIRSIAVHRDERRFVSGSRDRTVKLWSLDVYKSFLDAESSSSPSSSSITARKNPSPLLPAAFGECLRTYNGHRKSVFEVFFFQNESKLASCDAHVHIWEPESGKTLQQYEFGKSNPVVAMDLVEDAGLIAAATSSSSIQFIDARLNRFVQEWKVSYGIGVKVIATDHERGGHVAVGYSTGYISLFDSRTGMLLGHWKAHETEVTELVFCGPKRLVSVADNLIHVWLLEGPLCSLESSLKAASDILALHLSHLRLFSIGNGNSFSCPALDFSQSHPSPPEVIRLKNAHLKSQITSFSTLPLNQLVLFGNDDGTISLFA